MSKFEVIGNSGKKRKQVCKDNSQQYFDDNFDYYDVDGKPLSKSKEAAKHRREKENTELQSMAHSLPLPSAIAAQLDKASIIRLTAAYFRLYKLISDGILGNFRTFQQHCHLEELASCFMQTIDGFVFIIAADGKINYISETASFYLGLSQVEMIGNNIYDYLHEGDHQNLNSILQQNLPELSDSIYNGVGCEADLAKQFVIRLKSVLPKRNAGLTINGFKVVHCFGFLKLKRSGIESVGCLEPVGWKNLGLLAIGGTIPSSAHTEVKLSSHMFMFRTSFDFKLIFLDLRLSEVTGFDPQEILDKSFYNLVHPDHVDQLYEAHSLCKLLPRTY